MKYLATLLMLVCMSALASAQLVKENFDYPNGAAIDTLGGWSAHSGSGPALISDSVLTYTGYAGSGVGNALDVFGTGEDVNKTFPDQSRDGETIYLSALIKVVESGSGLSGSYFLHLGNKYGSSFYYCARVFLKVDASDNVLFGLSNSSTPTWGTTNFSKNMTYLLILKYKISSAGNDTTALWILPSGVPADEGTAGTPEVSVEDQTGQDYINAVAIRQASGIPDYVLDGIRIADTWENSVGGVDAPIAVLSPGSLNFGKILIGKHATDSIMVQNAGYASLDITSANPSAAVYTVTPSSVSIPAQDSMKFAVKYTPTTAQLDSENVAFVSNAASSPDTVMVKGTGKEPGFSVTPKSLNFGKVWKGSTVTDTLFVSNLSATDNLVIDSIVVADTMYSISPMTADIAVSASDTFILTFNPTIKGVRSGPILFYHDSPAVADTAMVTGTCITHEPQFVAMPDTLDFHGVLIGKSKTDTITVTNAGYDSLFITNVTSSNAAFTVAPVAARLDSMAAKKFAVTFTPASAGVKSGRIVFDTNMPSGHDTVAVSGAGSSVMSIADARKDANGDLVPDLMVSGDTVFVAGVVTSPNVQTAPQTGIFIQDSTAGIELFSYDAAPEPLAIGDSVFVIGKLDQYHGLTELTPLAMDTVNLKILKHNAVVPKAKVLTLAQFLSNAEEYEGSLVEVDTLYYLSGTWPTTAGANASVYYTTKDGGDSVQIFFDKDANADGSTQPADPVNFTGILSQYSSGSTLDNGYELMPRDTTDFVHVVIDAVNGRTDGIPKTFYLSQNYPNPFNPSTVIEFGLPKESSVQITVYNVLGQRVAVLVNNVMKAGNHKLVFNGARLASGVYFYVMRTGEKIFKHKMLLMK